MNKQELRQKMMMCVATLMNLNGSMPGAPELYAALGNDYKEVLEEFFSGKYTYCAAA